ncbi:alpha-galactosidase [Filimonas lacunae]|nr:hypothetical protein [Filimonas lacunae]BAV07946.1 alpha-galactosidase [Filimonas lacunae]
MKYFFLLLVSGTGMLISTSCQARPKSTDTLNIPFGARGRIIYHLQQGTYSVLQNEIATVHNAYALCQSRQQDYDSRNPGTHTYTQTTASTPAGKATVYTITHQSNNGQLQQLFYIYPHQNYFITQVRVKSEQTGCNKISPMVAAVVDLPGKGNHPYALQVPFDNDMWARYHAQELGNSSFTSSEVTALYNNDTYAGIVLGSLEQDVWKSGIGFSTGNETKPPSMILYAGLADSIITHDRCEHGAVLPQNGYCTSPKMMVGFFDDWRNGMETYARLHLKYEPRIVFSWNQATPMGWNSWGAIQDKISYNKAAAVTRFFVDSCQAFRNADNSLFIDLDSFWDNMVEGGLDGNTNKLQQFVAYCKKNGFKPGIYWGPFTDWGKYDRAIEGSSFQYQQTWTQQNGKFVDTDGGRAMDPTHPGTRDRVRYTLSHLVKLGFQMIKIDFLSHGAIEGDYFYDPTVTTGMQAYRKGMELVDSVLDGKMLVYAAISPNIATARYVHMRRIACDAFSAIDNTEYTLNSTGYGWWQNQLYNYIDADHVVFGTAPDNMNRARLASSLVTGTLTTGDDFSSKGKWTSMALQLLQNKALLTIAKNGKSFRPVDANTGNKGVNVFTQEINGQRYIAVFNYTDKEQEYHIPLQRAGVLSKTPQQATELFSNSPIPLNNNSLQVTIPASDAVIYRLNKL